MGYEDDELIGMEREQLEDLLDHEDTSADDDISIRVELKRRDREQQEQELQRKLKEVDPAVQAARDIDFSGFDSKKVLEGAQRESLILKAQKIEEQLQGVEDREQYEQLTEELAQLRFSVDEIGVHNSLSDDELSVLTLQKQASREDWEYRLKVAVEKYGESSANARLLSREGEAIMAEAGTAERELAARQAKSGYDEAAESRVLENAKASYEAEGREAEREAMERGVAPHDITRIRLDYAVALEEREDYEARLAKERELYSQGIAQRTHDSYLSAVRASFRSPGVDEQATVEVDDGPFVGGKVLIGKGSAEDPLPAPSSRYARGRALDYD
jgi:hypothetical protein